MRKRTATQSGLELSAALAIIILVAGCDRSADSVEARTKARDLAMSVEGSSPSSGGMAVPEPTQRREGVASANAPVVESAVDRSNQDGSRRLAMGSSFPAFDASGAMLIRHGQASVEVKRVDDAVAKVRQTAAQFGGFVANTSLRSGKDEQRAATLEIRVPTAQFDGLLSALSGIGKVESIAATAQDVGDEYVDMGARVANARRVEARLVEMLASRTGKLSEVLTVEQELRRIREEIERYEARLKWLERRTALSSLDVSLHEPLPLIERQPGPGPIAEAFAEAWARAVGVLAWCIASLGLLLPLGVLIAVAVVVARRLLRPGAPPGVSGA